MITLKIRSVEQQAIDYLKAIAKNEDVYIGYGLDEQAKIILHYIKELESENKEVMERKFQKNRSIKKYKTRKEYKKEAFDKLNDTEKLEWMCQMSKQLCEIIEYAKQRCDGYLEDLENDYDCEYCDGAFNSCKKVLQLAGEDIKKYE